MQGVGTACSSLCDAALLTSLQLMLWQKGKTLTEHAHLPQYTDDILEDSIFLQMAN